MRKFRIVLFALVAFSFSASAQVSVESATPKKEPKFKNEIKKTDELKPETFNEAEYRAKRAAIRKERNTIELSGSITGSLSNFNSAWRSVNGNTNSFTGIANILFTHSFKKDLFSIDTKVTAKLGYTQQKGSWSKSQDEWFVSVSPAYTMTETWKFGAILSLRSQFARGEKDDLGNPTSAIFAPAYIDLSVGFTYVSPNKKFPIKINLSPISMNSTVVTSDSVHDAFMLKQFGVTYAEYLADRTILDEKQRHTAYCYGLTPNNRSFRAEGGSSIQIDFDKTFGKQQIFRYRTTFNAFYGWINELVQQTGHDKELYAHLAPTMRWEHTLDIKATKYITTQIYFQMYYNKAQSKSIQTQTILGVGLAYTFKNK